MLTSINYESPSRLSSWEDVITYDINKMKSDPGTGHPSEELSAAARPSKMTSKDMKCPPNPVPILYVCP